MNKNAAPYWSSSHNPVYASRAERNVFVAQFIAKEFPSSKTITNIGGGGKRHLQKALTELSASDKTVTEVDMVGDCDHIVNLDKVDQLPFDDNASDLCVATDILEHLENFHLMSEELVRVAKEAVIISLPVPTNSFVHIFGNRRENDAAQRGVYDKYYGLPLEKPEDRHRWWYTVEDVERYFMHLSEKMNVEVEFFTSDRSYKVQGFKGKLLRLLLGKRLYRNIRYPYVWIILKKR